MSRTHRKFKDKTPKHIERSGQRDADKPDKNLSKQSCSKPAVLITLLIVVCAAVLTAYWPVLSAQAIFIDDNEYITENPLVQNPGWRSARQIITEVSRPSTVHGYYQPGRFAKGWNFTNKAKLITNRQSSRTKSVRKLKL